MVRGNQELKEKIFSFTITDEEVNKMNYLQTLCRQMALDVRVADAVSYVIAMIFTLYINPQTTVCQQVCRECISQIVYYKFCWQKSYKFGAGFAKCNTVD